MRLVCKTCGKEFNLKPSAVAKGRGKYCSMHCRRRINTIKVEEDIAYIELTDANNVVIGETLIDAKDVDKIKKFDRRWHASWHKTTNQYFAQANIKLSNGKWSRISLHRFILDAPDGHDVDHINHNMLDNRRCNLRICTRGENLQNRRGAQRNTTSGIRGVCWDANRGKWLAHLTIDGGFKYLGRYDNIQDAKRAAEKGRAKYMPFSKEAMAGD